MTQDLLRRLAEHQRGANPRAFTYRRRPVTLVWSEAFATHDEAFLREQQIKSWSQDKKRALIQGDFDVLRRKAKRRG